VRIFTRNLGFPEAPVHLPDGDFLCVEMSPDKGGVTRVSADGATQTMLAKTGRPNGLALDRNGLVWVAETAMRAVLKMTLDGKYEVIADRCQGDRFLFLNDLAFGPNGDLFVTDSGILLDEIAPGGELVPNWRDLKFDGRVYRIDVHTRQVEMIDRGIQFTNGIAFSPSGDLFIAETLSGNIYRYACRNGGVTGKRTLFGNVIEQFNAAELKGPDGMKFAKNGRLYACVFGQGNVTVLDTNGKVVERISTDGICPTNLAFARDGRRQIYVTEVITGTVQMFDVQDEGLPLHG
jgi:gluconolactonase